MTPNIHVGTTTTLAAGSDATVTRRAGSPDAAPIFDFGIPKGADAGEPRRHDEIRLRPHGEERGHFCLCRRENGKDGGAFTGAVSGVSPTSGSAKGFRNIYFGSGAPGSSLGANGDVYINIGKEEDTDMIKAGNKEINDSGFAVVTETVGGVARQALVLELSGRHRRGDPGGAVYRAGPGGGRGGQRHPDPQRPLRVATHGLKLVRTNASGDVPP